MPLPRALFAIPLTVLLLASCDKEDTPPPAPVTAAPQLPTSSASIMLRGKFDPPAGSTLAVTQKLFIENADILQRVGENDTTGSMTISQTERQTLRFGEDGAREIDIADGGSVLTTQFGEAKPVEESQPDKLTGKTLVATPAPDSTWSYVIKGEPTNKVPAGFRAADLRSDELYPEQWKSFNETWSPAPSALGALLGPGFQITEGKITMRLLGTSRRGGQPCAEIAADIKAKGLFRDGKARQDISIELKGKIYRSLDLFQDLEAKLSGTIEMYQRMGNADVRIEGPVTFQREAIWTPKNAPPAE